MALLQLLLLVLLLQRPCGCHAGWRVLISGCSLL